VLTETAMASEIAEYVSASGELLPVVENLGEEWMAVIESDHHAVRRTGREEGGCL
jgi:hypothetical protein